jgi:hypothetical protein
MNRFTSLDLIFPCTPNRGQGEVVSVSLAFNLFGFEDLLTFNPVSWKRKAWYVNASVNAFHMHRGLCREFKEQLLLSSELSERRIRSVTRAIGDAVMHAYVANWLHGVQYHKFEIDLYSDYNDASVFFLLEGDTTRHYVDSHLQDWLVNCVAAH